MLKIIFVDDELITIKMLKKLIDWGGLGIEISGEAYNGLEALKLVDLINPDIVLVDIKMPVMDGMKFMEELKQRGNNAAVIVLSAYGEFSYAQKAISCGAKGYLLKPVDENKLLDLIYEIKNGIIEERNRLLENETNRRKASEVIKIEYSKTLTDAIENSIDESMAERLKNISINIGLKNYAVVVIKARNAGSSSLDGGNVRKSAIESISIIENVFKANLVNSLVFKKDTCESIAVINYSDKIDIQEMERKTHKLASGIVVQFNIMKQVPAIVGVSNVYKDVLKLKEAYNEACTASQNAFYHRIDKPYFYGDASFSKPAYSEIMGDNEKLLVEYMKQNSKDLINASLKNVFEKCYEKRVEPKCVYEFCFELLLSIKKSITNYLNSNEVKIAFESITYDEIKNLQTIYELKMLVNTVICKVTDLVSLRCDNSEKICVENVKKFIKSNYASSITLESISESVSLSKSYLCKLFKQEEGKGIWDYLTEVRTEKAKELLKTTNLKNYEIASLIGYDSTYYFSKIFKKSVGMTPLEYKNKF